MPPTTYCGRGRPRKSDGPRPSTPIGARAARLRRHEAATARTGGRKNGHAAGRKRARDHANEEQENELPGLLSSSAGKKGKKAQVKSSGRVAKATVKKRRRAVAETEDVGEGESEGEDAVESSDHQNKKTSARKFARLKPYTHHVLQSVITTKWRPASLPAQAAARALFDGAKRSVVAASGKSADVEATLAAVVRKLNKQVPRVPLPPAKVPARKAVEAFDLEKVVQNNRILEGNLTPALHSVKLLRAAVAAENMSLEKDKEALRTLEKRAEDSQKESLKRGRKALHPTLKNLKERREKHADVVTDDSAEAIRLAPASVSGIGWTGDLDAELEDDEQIGLVLKSLSSHVDSMAANLQQVDGLDQAMHDTRTAVEELFRGRLDPDRYRKLVSSVP